jgi:hypothetical protein
VRVSVALVLILLAVPLVARGQEAPPRVEVGPEVSQFQVPYWPTDVGGGAHVTVALTPLIAIETRVRAFTKEPFPSAERGGRTVQLFSGARATFLSPGRLTIYGLLLPGLIHYSSVVTRVGRDAFAVGPTTHVALDMGLGASFRLHDRWSAFADLSGPLYGVRGSDRLSDFPPAAALGLRDVIDPASVQSTNQLTAGVSYRAGRLGRSIEPTHRGTWMAGGNVGVAAYAPVLASAADVIKATRVGGFTSFPLTAWMDGDVGAEVYLHTDNSHSAYEGGRISQGVAGVKVGRRSGRLGYFGKIRAGVQSYSGGLISGADFSQPPPYRRPVYGRRYRPILDVGTVIETTLASRLVWRVDVSDIVTFYPNKTVLTGDMPVAQGPLPASDTVAVTTGIAWRFGRQP